MQPGTQLGHYEITSELGRGGMGEVWRARDTKLGREVAIKVLPPEFSQDTERLARLEREARMLAALNHPNIASIHGLEESGETRFLVLELVEGDTLADKLKQGPVSVAESLKLAVQIAEALEAAHEKSVIHRDLKPANIKVTPEGRVKVLDFGLAKAFIGEGADVNLSHSPTLSMQATQAGIILGTAAYMSPEQARGEVADQRADIWAFGTVLFQMLTGQGAFDGKTVSDILASVLKTDPDWSALPGTLNPRIRFLLERCLEKEPRDRCQSISEVRAEIARTLADPKGLAHESAEAFVPARAPSKLPWVAALVLAVVAAGAAWILTPSPAVEPGLVARFSQELGNGQLFRNMGRDVVAVSPDGRQVAYNTTSGLYLRSLDAIEPRLIPGTEGAMTNPFFSPDGEWIGYWDAARGELRRIRTSGGASVLITTATNPQGASWNNDTIVFGQPEGIMRVSGDGGPVELVVASTPPEQLWDPQILPNGAVLFVAWLNTQGTIAVASPGSEERANLFPGGRAIWVPTRHLIVTDPQASPNTLLARAFDLASLAYGGAVPIEEGVADQLGRTHYAVSPEGSLAYIFAEGGLGGARPQRTLVWVDREGRETPLPLRPDDYTAARISPDGTKVALVVGSSIPISDPPPDIWILDLGTGTFRQLTFNADIDDMPVWSRESDRIYYRSWRDGEPAIYSIPADGGDGQASPVGASPDFGFPGPWSISPDGGVVAFNYGASLDNINLATLSLDGNGVFTALLAEPGLEVEPVIAPNGQWLAYQFLATNQAIPEINVRPFPGVAPQRIPVVQGVGPVFSPDGTELFYFDGEGISVFDVGYEPGFFVRNGRNLFRRGYQYGSADASGFGGRAWDLDPGGERFLMINLPGVTDTGDAEASVPRVHIVTNWFGEVTSRAPNP